MLWVLVGGVYILFVWSLCFAAARPIPIKEGQLDTEAATYERSEVPRERQDLHLEYSVSHGYYGEGPDRFEKLL